MHNPLLELVVTLLLQRNTRLYGLAAPLSALSSKYVVEMWFMYAVLPLRTCWTPCLLTLHVFLFPNRIVNDWWVVRVIACDR